MDKNTLFICTNAQQYLGALVAKHTFEKYSRHRERFDIQIIEAEKVPALNKLHGRTIFKDGREDVFDENDLQTFTLTRFMPPELMDYRGKAIVIDPDVFSVGTDIWTLFSMDMAGHAILCRRQNERYWGTSVMVLDNAKLRHWSIDRIVDDLLERKMDYRDQMGLKNETQPIGLLQNNWNDFDHLDSQTKLLHYTLRVTQPWRVGLKVTYRPKKMKPLFGFFPREWVHTLLGKNPRVHREHPDPRQSEFFFREFKDALQQGKLTREQIEEEKSKGYLRRDVLEILDA